MPDLPTEGGDTAYVNQGEQVSPWVNAPGDSHVAAFRMLDRSLSEFGATSEIQVTFKGRKNSPPATYTYKISSHDEAKQIFADLQGAAHPGEVIDERLKKPRYPYTRIS